MAKRLTLVAVMLTALTGCVFALRHDVAAARGSSPPVVQTAGDDPAPPAVRTALQQAVRDGGAGITAIVMRDGHLLYRLEAGAIDPHAQYPVASASKWMAAALVMTVVDEGKLALDAPISHYLPEFTGEAGTVTLRELLAQTSGEGSLRDAVDIRQDPRITLAASAAQVARRPLDDPPGTVFKYGGPGFQVAGALVERATGQRWADLFETRIAAPLGMTHTYWAHLPAHGVAPAQTLNPLLQGGAVSTADDYMRFLTLLAQGGSYEGRRVLSTQAVEAMETVQTLGKPMAYEPRGAADRGHAQYALGNWCEAWTDAGRCTLVSSPGAFGTFPWIDRRSGVYGIFFTRTRMPRVVGDLVAARRAILAAAP